MRDASLVKSASNENNISRQNKKGRVKSTSGTIVFLVETAHQKQKKSATFFTTE